MHDRIPPQDLAAEAAVLGAVLVDRAMLGVVSERLEPRMFYAPAHERIFTAMLTLDETGRPIDKVSLGEHLRGHSALEKIGGMAYLSLLMDTVPSSDSAAYYASIVLSKARLRALISASTQIARLGYEGEDDVDSAVDEADSLMREAIAMGSIDTAGIEMGAALKAAILRVGERSARPPTMDTPWPGVNECTAGALPGECWLIAAAPAVGKSGAAMQLVDYIAAHYGRVAMFALEMGVDSTVDRLLATYSKVPMRVMRRGETTQAMDEALSIATEMLHDREIIWFGPRTRTIAAIRRELRKLASRGPIRAVVIDHVNFISDSDDLASRKSKHQHLDRLYTDLILLGKDLGFWLIVVQHVNRDGMKAGANEPLPEPTKTSIRDGGNIEGHAHCMIFPHREFPEHEDSSIRREGKIIIAKTRDGVTGKIPMDFNGARHLWLEKFSDGSVQTPWFEGGSSHDEEVNYGI